LLGKTRRRRGKRKGRKRGGGTHQPPTVTFTTDVKQHSTGLSVYGAGVCEWHSQSEDVCGDKGMKSHGDVWMR
jgi:hypothetical protein